MSLARDLSRVPLEGADIIPFDPDASFGEGTIGKALSRINRRALVADIAGDYSTGTGTGTDDGPAILAALQALNAAGGGTLVIPYHKKPYIGTSFEMPANTAIRFDHCPRGTHDGLALPGFTGTLWLSPAATITMGNGCQLHANLFRAGLTFGITAAQVAATFVGTAILLKSNCANIAISGMILGFQYSIEPQDPANGDGTKQHNRIDLNVVVDCINGPHIHNSYDIGRHNGVHCWPFVTVTSAAEANGAQLKRSGYGLWLSGVNDWTMVFQHFSYGYAVGCRLTDCGSVTVVNGGHDHVPGSTDGSIGYLIEGNAREITLVAPQVAGKQYGIVINSTTATGRLACEVVAPRVWVTTTYAIDIQGGSVKVSGGTLRNDFSSPNGIGVKNRNAGAAEVMLNGVDFCGLATGIENQSATSILRHSFSTFRAVSTQITNAYVPTIASAATIAPNGVDEVFNVTGTNNIGTISSPQRYVGRRITLNTVSALTVLAGGNIKLKDAVNFAMAAGDTLTLLSDGSNWYEVSRTQVNAWVTSFVPTITATSGAITTSAATCQYKREGANVHFAISITITTNGTGAGTLRATLPFASTGNDNVFVGRDRGVSGKAVTATLVAGGSTLDIKNYDNSYPAADGAVIMITGTYRAS
jgi:hypothetical protein